VGRGVGGWRDFQQGWEVDDWCLGGRLEWMGVCVFWCDEWSCESSVEWIDGSFGIRARFGGGKLGGEDGF